MNKLGSDLADAWLNKKLVDLNKFNNNEIPKTREEAYKALNIFYKKLNKKTVGWKIGAVAKDCLLYTSPSPRDGLLSRMPSSA